MHRPLYGVLGILVAVMLAACGQDAGSPSAQQETPYAPSAAEVAKWPGKWCDDVHVPMPRGEVIRVMGSPTEAYPDQDQWDGFGYHFTAFYDESGNARQLDINDLGMSATQKAKVTCDDTRS